MALQKYKSQLHAVTNLRQRGYNNRFELAETGLYCITTGKVYHHQDMLIAEVHRIVDRGQTGFNTVVFAVECVDGKKGFITSAGVYPNLPLITFMSKVKVKVK